MASVVLSIVRILSYKYTRLEAYSDKTKPVSDSESSPAGIDHPSLLACSVSRVQTAHHELPTATATAELDHSSPIVELSSPVSPMEVEEASCVNGSRGSISSGLPPYMPSSERAMSEVLRRYGTGEGK